MTRDPMTIVLAVLIGLAVGSFLNVCIHRLPRGESLVRPASRCPRCGRPLRWHDNIPVLSWLWLGGKCGHCQAPISVQYPIVELITATLVVGIVMVTPPGPLLASRLVFACALVVLFAVDLEHHLLPNVITLPGILIGWLFSVVAAPGWQASLAGILLGAGLLYGTAAAYYMVRGEEGLGMGDVKMLAMIGAFLGWKAVLLTLVLASFAGALVGIAMMMTSRGGMRYALPFGTFLAVGSIVAMLIGDQIIAWYLGFLPTTS